MPRNGKGALFVLVALLAALVAAIVTLSGEGEANAVPMLVETALMAAAMVVLTGVTSYKLWRHDREQRMALESGLMMRRVPAPWRWLSRRQWNTLTVGLTAIVTLTSALTGLHVRNADGTSANPTATGTPMTAPVLVDPTPTEGSVVTDPPSLSPTPESTDLSPDPAGNPTEDPTDDPTDAGTTDPTDPPPLPAIRYLDEIDKINGGWSQGGPVYFSGREYPRSVTLDCESSTDYFVWEVAGYRTLKATIGVDDDTHDAIGGIAELIFYDQDGHQLGKPVDVSLGHSKPISLSLAGVVQLRVTCAGHDSKTHDGRSFTAALGNGQIFQ